MAIKKKTSINYLHCALAVVVGLIAGAFIDDKYNPIVVAKKLISPKK